MLNILESFNWLSDARDLIIEESTPGAVRLKVKFAHAGEISKNGRKYLDEELVKGTRTMIGKSVNLNHQNNVKVGRIPWAEYEDGEGEAVIEITKQPYVDLIKSHNAKIKGVSMQAQYLVCQCIYCGKKFASETEINKHLKDVEGRPTGNAPRGLFFGSPADPSVPAMALVFGDETPGCNTSMQVMETVGHGWMDLVETVLKEKAPVEISAEFSQLLRTSSNKFNVDKNIREMKSMEKTKAQVTAQPKASIAAGPVPHLYESEAPEKPGKPVKEADMTGLCKTCGKPLKDGECWNKECKEYAGDKDEAPKDDKDKEAEPVAKEVVLREGIKAGKLTLKEFTLPNFTSEQVESGQANQVIKERKELNESFKFVSTTVNGIIEYLETPVKVSFPAFPKIPKDDLGWKNIVIPPVYNDKELREMIANLPKDDLTWKDEIAKLPKDDVSWVTKLTEQEATLNKKIEQLTETLKQTKQDFETVLAVADKNISETRKTLEERIAELKKTNETQATELKQAKETLEKTKTLAENTEYKIKGNFKGHAQNITTETNNKSIIKDPITGAS